MMVRGLGLLSRSLPADMLPPSPPPPPPLPPPLPGGCSRGASCMQVEVESVSVEGELRRFACYLPVPASRHGRC